MFGWWRCFHATASLQNLYILLLQHELQKKNMSDACAEMVFEFS